MRADAATEVADKDALMRHRYRSYDLFGAKVTPTSVQDILELLTSHIEARRQCIVASQNMHGLRVNADDPEFRELHQLPNTYVHLDGMPLVLLCRMIGVAASRHQRVTLIDLIWPLLDLASRKQWRIYYLGAEPHVLSRGLSEVRDRFPHLVIDGRDGYFDLNDRLANNSVLDGITRFRPHLVLVGMGMGRQEQWILRHRQRLAPAPVCTVGACIEYVAGAVRTPPRWMGRAGLEWLFRLVESPRRFGHRYAIEPWGVLAQMVRHAWKHR